MTIQYLNNQSKRDPLHGVTIIDQAQLLQLLRARRDETPFIAELRGDNGFELVIGIGREFCFAEHRPTNGDLPYLMATSEQSSLRDGIIEFLTANTPTPIAARYIISFDELSEIAQHFLATGERSNAVRWEPI